MGLNDDSFEKRWHEMRAEKAARLGLSLEGLKEYEAEQERKEREREAARWAAEWRSGWLKAGVPVRALKAADSPTSTPALQAIWESVDLLVLAGTPGVGKSVAACVWLMLNCQHHEHACWIQAGDLARGYAYEQDAFDRVTKSSALVIDDLGQEYLDQKDRYLCTLEEILSKRYANERPTLLTTNCSPEAFKERYGERLVSRIHEDGAFVVCAGDDLRRKSS